MHQVRDIGLALALAVSPAFADAEPIVLNCTVDGFSNVFQLVVDLETAQLKHGLDYGDWYPITSVTENFVTAMGPGYLFAGEKEWEHGPAPGGSVWVIERATGHFFWAVAGGTCTFEECEQGTMNASGSSGQCKVGIF
ncbi:hypothetical protein [Profundibacter sp.]